jgi:hypothetical protein
MIASGVLAVFCSSIFLLAIFHTKNYRGAQGAAVFTILQLIIFFGAKRRLKMKMKVEAQNSSAKRKPRDWMGNPLE